MALPPELQAALRADALPVLFGGVLLAGGILCILFGLTRRPRNTAFVGLGLSGGLYGARLLVASRTAVEVFGLSATASRWATVVISYVIVPPFLLFFASLLAGAWKRRLRALLWVNAAFAAVALGAEGYLGRPGAASNASSILVLITLALLLAAVVKAEGFSRWEARRLRAAFLCMATFAALENLRGLGLVRWPANIEPLGMAGFLGLLISIAARRIGETEGRLAVLHHELETARGIQRGLLPRVLPRIDGVSLAVRYLPADEVGGDFYDVVQVGDRALGVLVADVSGHGIPAALIASMVKVAAAAQPAQEGRPERVLGAVQRALTGQLQRQFVTAACMVIDAEAMVCTWANAGHPPPLLVRDGTVRELEPTGGAIGRLGRSEHEALRATLSPGDRIVLFSDAVTEALSPQGEPFGDVRLAVTVCRETEGVESLAEALLADLRAWTGRAASDTALFDDDLTLVIIEVGERPATAEGLPGFASMPT